MKRHTSLLLGRYRVRALRVPGSCYFGGVWLARRVRFRRSYLFRRV